VQSSQKVNIIGDDLLGYIPELQSYDVACLFQASSDGQIIWNLLQLKGHVLKFQWYGIS
jgi:hypothetical protein